MEDVCEEEDEEVMIEPLLKKLHSFSDTWHGFSRKQAIHKYPSSPHYESDIDQLSWTIRMNVIEIFQCSYLSFYHKKCLRKDKVSSIGTGPVSHKWLCAQGLTGLVYVLLSLS